MPSDGVTQAPFQIHVGAAHRAPTSKRSPLPPLADPAGGSLTGHRSMSGTDRRCLDPYHWTPLGQQTCSRDHRGDERPDGAAAEPLIAERRPVAPAALVGSTGHAQKRMDQLGRNVPTGCWVCSWACVKIVNACFTKRGTRCRNSGTDTGTATLWPQSRYRKSVLEICRSNRQFTCNCFSSAMVPPDLLKRTSSASSS